MNYTLRYDGATLAEWRIPKGWVPSFGTLLAVPYNGRLTLFRAVGMNKSEIELALCQS